MNGNRMRPVGTLVLLVLAVAAAFGLGLALRQALPVGVAFAEEATPASAYEGPWATVERQIVGNEERGKIRVEEQAVLEIQTSAGGLSGYERSVIVAKRLNDALSAGVRPDQIRAAEMNGMSVLMAGDRILITVNSEEAYRHGTSVAGLASTWAHAIGQALGGQPAVPVTPPPTDPTVAPGPDEPVEPTPLEEDWTPPEPYRDKIVPIVSVLEGFRVGVARVNGPSSKVELVQAVAQLESDYERVLVMNLYVPISTEVPGKTLDRVQGVGVTAIGDIRIR